MQKVSYFAKCELLWQTISYFNKQWVILTNSKYYFEKVIFLVKLNLIVILAKRKTRDLKPCDFSQKFETVSKDNDFEVLELWPETNIHVQ